MWVPVWTSVGSTPDCTASFVLSYFFDYTLSVCSLNSGEMKVDSLAPPP